MADQLRHAPWLLLSIVIHGIAIAIFMLIPPSTKLQQNKQVTMQPEPEPEPIQDEQPPEPEPVEQEPEKEPELVDAEITETEDVENETFDDVTESVESAMIHENWTPRSVSAAPPRASLPSAAAAASGCPPEAGATLPSPSNSAWNG